LEFTNADYKNISRLVSSISYSRMRYQMCSKLESAFVSVRQKIVTDQFQGIQIVPETDFIRLNLLDEARSVWLGFEEGKGYFLTGNKCGVYPYYLRLGCAAHEITSVLFSPAIKCELEVEKAKPAAITTFERLQVSGQYERIGFASMINHDEPSVKMQATQIDLSLGSSKAKVKSRYAGKNILLCWLAGMSYVAASHKLPVNKWRKYFVMPLRSIIKFCVNVVSSRVGA